MNLSKDIIELQKKYEQDKNIFKEISDNANYFQAMQELKIEVMI